MATSITTIVKPIILEICKLYTFKKQGVELELNKVERTFDDLFEKAKTKSQAQGEELTKSYKLLEKPLVFFVDYCIKEGGFSYSREYQPMARMYNELSGDEKFFDILESLLNREDTPKDVFEVFYLMLGVGFDGIFKRDPKETINYIYRLKEILPPYVDVNNEPLCPEIYQIHAKDKIDNDKNLAWYNSKKVLIGLLVATFLCFLINLFAISQNTKGFYRELDNAVEKASPYLNIGNQTQEDIEYKGEDK